MMLQNGQGRLKGRHPSHAAQQRQQPVGVFLGQIIIDEKFGEIGNENPRNHHGQADQGDKGDNGLGFGETALQTRDHRRTLTTRDEVRSPGKGQGHACEILVEFIPGDGSPPDRRIVEIDLATPKAFNNDKMIEGPKGDVGYRQVARRLQFDLVAIGNQAKTPRRPHHVARPTAITRHTAFDA